MLTRQSFTQKVGSGFGVAVFLIALAGAVGAWSLQRAGASAVTVGVFVVVAALAAVITAVIAFMLSRALRREVGTAVGHIQISSAELEAAAGQQATGALRTRPAR